MVKKLSPHLISKLKQEQSRTRTVWSEKEISILNQLIKEGITSREVVKQSGLFPNRTVNAIGLAISKIRRTIN